MKKLLFIVCVLFIQSFASQAQAPWWYRKTPESSSGEYCYVAVRVSKGDDDLKIAAEKARVCLGAGASDFQRDQNNPAQISFGGSSYRFQRINSRHRGSTEYILMMFTKSDLSKGDIDLKRVEKDFKNPYKNTLHAALPLSMILPGMGQMVKKQKGKGVLFLTTFLATAGAGVYFELDRQSNYDKFHEASTFDKREEYLDDIEKSTQYRNIAFGAAGVVYLFNLIDVIASKSRRLAYQKPKEKRMNWNFAYNPQYNSSGVWLAYRF